MRYRSLFDVKSVNDQAYFCIVHMAGSWLVEAIIEDLDDKEKCKRIVESFVDDYGDADEQLLSYINENYDGILEYREKRGS